MRELTKSMVGFSWAVGLFGFQQLTKVMSAGTAEPPEQTAAELDDVARAAERHLSDTLARQFQAADQWQRRLIDVFFDAASLRSFDPRAVAASFDPRPMMDGVDPRRVIQGSVDLLERSVGVLRQAGPSTRTNAPSGG
jgi:hypothetical protein